MNKLIIAAHLDGELRDLITKEKEETKKTYSHIIRIALRKYFNNKKNE